MFPKLANSVVCDADINLTNRSPASPSLRPQYRLLLAHDDEPTCRFIQDILENCLEISIVGRASDGNEAVALAMVHQPDVILIDVNQPSFHGPQTTSRIKEMRPGTVMIGISEYFTPSIYSAIRTAGAAALVCKSELFRIPETIVCALQQSIFDLCN